MNDLLPHKHGDEGEGSTHYACQEMMEKLKDKVGCCGCNNHACKPNNTQEEWEK